MELQATNQDAEDKKFANNRVKVAIRVRPFIERERILGDGSCVSYLSDKELVLGNQKNFRFDQVFREESQQTEVYGKCIKGLVQQCFEGYNAAVLAYGQTGSGKTYTMGTGSTRISSEEMGIIPRVIEHIFEQVEHYGENREFNIRVTFLEIYNEQIIDLLSEDHGKSLKNRDSPLIAIREEKDGSVGIYGATEEEIKTPQEMIELLDKGSFQRTTASTIMNSGSSRSHAIFTINIEQHTAGFQKNQEMIIDQNHVTSKFVFVDLAGSERVKKTGATGTTFKQGININLGLLELGNVISSLAIEKKQPQYINYRNSKLTRILQDSLGGNSNTYMIACISPADSNHEESLNTIKYASKAMNIKNKPIINKDPQLVYILGLKQKIEQLEFQVGDLTRVLQEKGIRYEIREAPKPKGENSLGSSSVVMSHSKSSDPQRLRIKNSILEKKCEHLMIEIKEEKKRSNDFEIELYELKRDRDIIRARMELMNREKDQNEGESVVGYHHNSDFETEQDKMIPLIEDYLNQIQQLQSDVHEKESLNTKLQIEYTKLHDFSERDSKLLIKKNETILKLEKEIKRLKHSLKEARRGVLNESGAEGSLEVENVSKQSRNNSLNDESLERLPLLSINDPSGLSEDSDMDDEISQISGENHLQDDEEYKSEISNHEGNQMRLNTELKEVEGFIKEKQDYLSQVTNEQVELEYRLIEEMKEEYHRKINEIEKEKQMLLRQEKSQSHHHNSSVKVNKVTQQKVSNLEIELKELKNKIKEQKKLELKVNTQNGKLKSLTNEISQFKLQKIELSRKIKEDKEKFSKFKNKRSKELVAIRRENNKKDFQIRKLKNENKKFAQQALRKKEEIKRVKKANETLKGLMKPKRSDRASRQRASSSRSLTSNGSSNVLSNSSCFSNRAQSSVVGETEVKVFSEEQLREVVNRSLQSIVIGLDRDIETEKLVTKCESIEGEIEALSKEEAELGLQIERLRLRFEDRELMDQQCKNYEELEKFQEERESFEQMNVKIEEVTERRLNLEEDLHFRQKKFEDLIQDSQSTFDYESEIIYNANYQNVETLRLLLSHLYRSMTHILTENINLKDQNSKISHENSKMEEQIQQLKEHILNISSEHQLKLSRLREEMMERQYEQMQQENNNNQNNSHLNSKCCPGSRTQVEENRKKYEKKIEELNKINRTLTKEIQVLRKRNSTISDKYNNLKSLFNKDKFIGIQQTASDQESPSSSSNVNIQQKYGNPSISTLPTTNIFSLEKRPHGTNTSSSPINSCEEFLPSIPEESNSISCSASRPPIRQNIEFVENQLQNLANTAFNKERKRPRNFPTLPPEHSRQPPIKRSYEGICLGQTSEKLSRLEFSRNNWECYGTIEKAHNSPVLSIASGDNFFVSTSNRAINFWDTESLTSVKEISFAENNHNYVGNHSVKCCRIHPQNHQLLFTAADRNITLWDLRTFNAEMTLKGHKDEIRTLHFTENTLYSAGKGTTAGGSILAWDLRTGNTNPIAEKERNQDIFSMTSYDGVLYYGARNHQVKRMKIPTHEILTAFQPPHMDTVTGLTTLGGYLISGSKDKNLRLWSLDCEFYNLKSTMPTFNEHITSLESDNDMPIFYVSDRSGQVKIGTIFNEKIEFLGGFLAHSQQINAMSQLKSNSYRGLLATASSDKSIKLWRPTAQTLNHLMNDLEY